MKQLASFVFVAVAWSQVAVVNADEPPTSKELLLALNQTINLKNFRQRMNLRDTLGLIQEYFAARSLTVVFSIDNAAYRPKNKTSGLGGVALSEGEVDLIYEPPEMRVGILLAKTLHQLPGELTYIVRDGFIEITSKQKASVRSLLQRNVSADCEKKSLSVILAMLSGQTGASIIVDPRIKDKADAPISAMFRNDVTLESALYVLTDMADLDFVVMPTGVYVTTEERANKLRKRLSKREFEHPGF